MKDIWVYTDEDKFHFEDKENLDRFLKDYSREVKSIKFTTVMSKEEYDRIYGE